MLAALLVTAAIVWSGRHQVALQAPVAMTAGLVVVLQLPAIYTPLRDLLDLETLGATDLATCVAAGLGLLAVLEVVKARDRRA